MSRIVDYAAAIFFMEMCVGVSGSRINPVLYSFLKYHIDTRGAPLSKDPDGFCNFLREVIKQLDP